MEKLNSMLETAGQLTPSSFYEDEYGQITFLPTPIFSPTWPTKNKLAHTALTLLLDGRLIDHPLFEDATGSWRLGAVIFQLRELGWPIKTLLIPSPTESTPDRKIALYGLDSKYISLPVMSKGEQ